MGIISLVLISLAVITVAVPLPSNDPVKVDLSMDELSRCLKVKPSFNSTLIIEPDKLYWMIPESNNIKYCGRHGKWKLHSKKKDW
jgi:hypothetical protein